MRWFEGNVATAVQTAKANKSVFIVFIADPVVVIPSVFFIGDNGVPLEVIGECKSPEDFNEKVKKALEMQKNMASSSPAPPEAATANTDVTPEPVKSEQKPSEIPGKTVPGEETSSAAGATATAAESGTGSGDDTVESQASGGAESKAKLDERVDRAKDLIEQKRQEKMKKEAEDERRREIERRNIGQGVQKLREQQKQMELLEAKRELQKDKENDRIARQKVKEEIERD
ncbi:UBX domain protein 4, partial [Elysia marginata]